MIATGLIAPLIAIMGAMANEEHVEIVRRGTEAIDEWRRANPSERLNLTAANLTAANLTAANLTAANLTYANLRDADLRDADLTDADLTGADLHGANLAYANLHGADLHGADLGCAYLKMANLFGTFLAGANFAHAGLGWTTLGSMDLSKAVGLGFVEHTGPSSVGIDTLQKSRGEIPAEFLKGCGVDPALQAVIHGDMNVATDAFYEFAEKKARWQTCFISYATEDKEFVDRLQNALNDKQIVHWYAPEHGRPGVRLREQVDAQIRLMDRLVVVCSAVSLGKPWVKHEIGEALEQELKRDATVLYPVVIDGGLFEWDDSRRGDLLKVLAADFRGATKGKAFEEAFRKLLRGLHDDDEKGPVV